MTAKNFASPDLVHMLANRRSIADVLKKRHGIKTDLSILWAAWYEADEGDDPEQMKMGIGPTEQAAIDDLLENHPRDKERNDEGI